MPLLAIPVTRDHRIRTAISPLASSMIAPALPQISDELNLNPGSVLEAMMLSVFVLAYAVGPLFLVSIIHDFSFCEELKWVCVGTFE